MSHVGFYTETKHSSFEAFLEEQEMLFIESMQYEADNQWVELIHKFPQKEALDLIESWWDSEIAAFRERITHAYYRLKIRKLRRRLENKQYRIDRMKDGVVEKDLELYHAKGDLEIEKMYTAQLREARLCPECKERL